MSTATFMADTGKNPYKMNRGKEWLCDGAQVMAFPVAKFKSWVPNLTLFSFCITFSKLKITQ